MLPAATLLALAFSTLAIVAVARAGHEPLSSAQEAQFVASCENATGGALNCQCFLARLEADGYDTPDSLKAVIEQARDERLSGQPGTARDELAADVLACRN
jgi:hypothetical protein